ncbi:hypothetical protein PPF1_65 [Rhizobium phage vB_RleM_PPF1]|uniref:hypothetical protein n=1 Tax=Rhizobium phage vB_RleM_PPF1 TaxID=1498228 RepID=UPI000499FEBB|nr:hypothetical protein PPF1_65 [Rhizobium phage vB_RleM_PPF1]AID18378.1 hypothetical protein PPF1_65 [Rhizobium phage vB_RleM_PPF1]
MDTSPEVAITLASLVVAEVHRQTSEDAIRAMVDKKIASVVAETVDSAFRFGEIRKQIETAIKEALHLREPLDVPAYGTMVMALLRQKLDEHLGQLLNEKLAAEMEDILSIAPKEIKLTEVLEALFDDIDTHDRYGSHITCIIDDSSSRLTPGYYWIAIDPEARKEKYSCALRLGIDPNGKIYSLSVDQKDAAKTIIMGGMDKYQKLVFSAYCCGSKFIIDEFDPSTGIGDF